MISRKLFLAILVLITVFIGSCGNAGTTTRSAEDVIATAQAFADLTRAATQLTAPPTEAPPTATSTPPGPTSTPTATEGPPVVEADFNASVRNGPDETYERIDYLFDGQRGEVIGRYENLAYDPPTWWFIRRIDQGKDGWVWSGACTFYGDESGIPVISVDFTPSPEND